MSEGRIYITLTPRWTIHCENDSGIWMLMLHIMADGKQCGVAPVMWFSNREEAQNALDAILDGK